MPMLDIDSLDRDLVLEESKGVVEAEKQCRIALSADAKRPHDLEWNPGGRNGRRSVIRVQPGSSVVQPLSKAQAWFGPFAIPLEYAATTDERKREILKTFYAAEKRRALERYDYERPTSVSKGGYEPIGPHRFPNIITTIIESDGREHESIHLHQLYNIGEWDPLKDSFGVARENATDVEARYKLELENTKERYERDLADLRRQFAEVTGMVKGHMAAAGGK